MHEYPVDEIGLKILQAFEAFLGRGGGECVNKWVNR